ncbi:potassium channel family protein [Solirubrobacter ginsenosidimutans]|uniref:potassium channel family protein n=1 Tax=Solirubrobacter ginsenosidimutans TaxID=490573 RepID=UPI0022CE0FBF|nr:potassium channel family protein [Solirubrobacter ginsenosidimutans]
MNLLLGAALILAFQIARARPFVVTFAYVWAAAGAVVALLSATGDMLGDGESRLMSLTLVALGPPALVVGLLRSLRASGRIGIEAVTGVLALYMLLGMLFAFLYGALDNLGGAPFFTNGTPATVSNCTYFSFTTLTTVGYGDLTARTDLGHTLAVFEALIGQIYLVTVVSLIVSNLGRARPNRS